MTKSKKKPIAVLGTMLSEQDQKYVLAAYCHRFTKEHVPAWTRRPDCLDCLVQFASDQEWLANTYFAITKTGKLDRRHQYCESNPTWPEGRARTQTQ